jgi:hypothetical protein
MNKPPDHQSGKQHHLAKTTHLAKTAQCDTVWNLKEVKKLIVAKRQHHVFLEGIFSVRLSLVKFFFTIIGCL